MLATLKFALMHPIQFVLALIDWYAWTHSQDPL